MRIVDIYAVGRERTEEEKRRRHLYGDKGAKFSQGKRLCLLGGGNRMCYHIGNKRQFSMRDIRVIQVGQLLKRHSQAYTLYDADGLCPTLSSGQKGMADYQLGLLYMIPKVLQIGNIVDDTNTGFKNPQRGRVYSVEGIAPSIDCMGGGNREPKIIVYE